jgi:hypothetical protein
MLVYDIWHVGGLYLRELAVSVHAMVRVNVSDLCSTPMQVVLWSWHFCHA